MKTSNKFKLIGKMTVGFCLMPVILVLAVYDNLVHKTTPSIENKGFYNEA